MPAAELAHVSVEVTDLVRARAFYDRFLPALGLRPFVEESDYAGYTNGPFTFWVIRESRPRVRRKPVTGDEEVVAEHLAFRVESPDAVRAIEIALVRGEIYPTFPGEEHPEFRTGYFSATWADPENTILEVYAIAPRRGASRPRAPPRRAPGKKRTR